MKDKILNFSSGLEYGNREIKALKDNFEKQHVINSDICSDINDLVREVKNMYKNLKISNPVELHELEESKGNMDWENKYFLKYNHEMVDSKIEYEVYKNPQLLPQLNACDWAVTGIAGLVATVLDFLVIRIPKNINYLNQFNQKGSSFTDWLKTLGVNSDGKLNEFLRWCENRCKVPYDVSVIKDYGVYPRNHRLRSIGHDPLFGLIFGLFDIFNGSITVFDKNGVIHNLKTYPSNWQDIVLAPLIWLGHMISDVCTAQGLPVPGWGLLQLLKVGSFGRKDRTISQISEWMYLNGYDLRHFITMSIVPATIEIIVRGYHAITQINDERFMEKKFIGIADKEIKDINSQIKLHKMLFLAHGFASGGNALKVWAYAGNPTSINFSEWAMFVKEGIEMSLVVTRDTSSEKVIRNRTVIDREWDEIQKIKLRNGENES